mmetsp:Transcript_5325/g.11715  ORF Transcript_5325/g.11715 Transcript_5325/m.11715 type:complete len:201 (-) Transcript_5325:713-1315(-)
MPTPCPTACCPLNPSTFSRPFNVSTRGALLCARLALEATVGRKRISPWPPGAWEAATMDGAVCVLDAPCVSVPSATTRPRTLGPFRRATPLGSRRPESTSRTIPVLRQHDWTTPRPRSVQKRCVGPSARPHGDERPVATSHTREPSRAEHCTLPALASVQNRRRCSVSTTRAVGSMSPRTTSLTCPVPISHTWIRPQLVQ